MSFIRAALVNFDSTLRLCRNGSAMDRQPPTTYRWFGRDQLFFHTAAAVVVAVDKFNRVRVIKLAQ